MQEILLTNANGLKVKIMAHGARIASILLPTAPDQYVDVVSGYDDPSGYEQGDHYQGAICGRVANRIAGGRFELKGESYQLPQNDLPNHLHGGATGFSNQTWQLNALPADDGESACRLSLVSEDGHEGYPGQLRTEVVYTLNNANQLHLHLQASTNKSTLVNLTSHPYFNLKGIGQGTVLDHFFRVNADFFTPLGATGTPSGEIRTVEDTPFDLRSAAPLQRFADSDYQQVQQVGGLDHNWALNKASDAAPRLQFACELLHPATGRTLTVHTTQPGLQAYLGMHFDGSQRGKANLPFEPFSAIAIEAQGFPDAPNLPNFPSVELHPGQIYREEIVYGFGF